jgi:hypothetical protein
VAAKVQINLTDEDSGIMPVAGGSFDHCYSAQAVVATESLLIVAHDVVQAANEKQQLAPMLGRLLADAGYAGEFNVERCEAGRIEPLVALGRERHNAGGAKALRAAQSDTRAGVRQHQISDGLPPAPIPWTAQRTRRMEPSGHQLEHQADVRPAVRLIGSRGHSNPPFRSLLE